jgi:putative inorganic carbon (HCO3(-)) transporter
MRRLTCRVADGEILLAPLVALFLIFPTRAPVLTVIGLTVLVGVWLARWWAQGHPLSCTPLNLALLLFLITVPAAVWASAAPDLTRDALAYLLASVILFTWGGLVVVGVTLAVLAPFSMRFSPTLFPLPALYTRWAGWMPETIHPNVMAGALVILWPLALSGFTSHVLRLVAILSTLLLLATLALTRSRGAYLGAAVSLLVLFSLRWPRAALVVVPLVVILALAGASFVGWDVIADELTTGDVTSGLDGRIEIWSRAIYAIQDFPFTGLGLGTFERVVAVLYPLFLTPAGTVPHAHNLFLQVAVDLGLLGLIAYLALLGLTFAIAFSTYRLFRQRGRHALASLCAGCIAGLAGMCVHGLVDAATWGLKLAFIPWVVMGLVVALHRVAKEQSKGEERRMNCAAPSTG